MKFDVGSGGVKVNGAKVVTADIVVDNGVIHVISSVMLPPQKPADFIKVCSPMDIAARLCLC